MSREGRVRYSLWWMRLSTATKAELMPSSTMCFESCTRKSLCVERTQTRYGTLLREHTPQVDSCQHRSPFGLASPFSNTSHTNRFIRQRRGCGRLDGYATPSLEEEAMGRDDDQEHDRLFTIAEANHLIPQLNARMASVHQAKAVLARTRDDIRR